MTAKSAIKAALPFIKTNNYAKVQQILDGECTEAQFIENVAPSYFTRHVIEFIGSFKSPDWFAALDKLPVNSMADFIHYTKQHKIDLSQQKDGISFGEALMNRIFQTDSYSRYSFIEMLDKPMVNDYLLKDNYQNFIRFLSSRPGYIDNPDWYSGVPFIKRFFSPDVIKSDLFQGIFTTPNDLSKSLLKLGNEQFQYTLTSLSDLLTPDTVNTLKSTHYMKAPFTNIEHGVSKENLKEIKQMLTHDTFKPNLELLNKDFYEVLEKGHRNALIPERVDILKLFIKKGFVSLDKLNSPPDVQYAPILTRYLKHSLISLDKDRNFTENATKLLAQIPELEAAGFMLAMKEGMKKEIEQLFNTNIDMKYSHGGFKRGDMIDDIERLSYELRIHPDMLERLVDFFDNRYNYKPEPTPLSEAKETLKTQWAELMQRVVIIPENKETATAKVKP